MSAEHACYPGSFDPVTLGHLDLVRRGARLYRRLTVAVGENADKRPLFTAEERAAMIRAELGGLDNVEVAILGGLAVDFCRERGCGVLLRGVRSVSDFESESMMAVTNRGFAPDIETVLMIPDPSVAHVSSRLIKEVAAAGGPLDGFLTPAVARALSARLREGGS